MEAITSLNPNTKVYLPRGTKTDNVFGVILMPVTGKFAEDFIPVLPEDAELNVSTSHNSLERYIVVGTKEQRTNYFKERFEGLVATKVCRKFNYFENPVDDELVKEYKVLAAAEVGSNFPQLVKRLM